MKIKLAEDQLELWLRSETNLDKRLENVLLHHNAIRKGLNKKVFEKDNLKKSY